MTDGAGSDVFLPAARPTVWNDQWLMNDYSPTTIRRGLRPIRCWEPRCQNLFYIQPKQTIAQTTQCCRDEWVSCQHCMQHGRIDDLIILLCFWYNVRCTACVCVCAVKVYYFYFTIMMSHQEVWLIKRCPVRGSQDQDFCHVALWAKLYHCTVAHWSIWVGHIWTSLLILVHINNLFSWFKII